MISLDDTRRKTHNQCHNKTKSRCTQFVLSSHIKGNAPCGRLYSSVCTLCLGLESAIWLPHSLSPTVSTGSLAVWLPKHSQGYSCRFPGDQLSLSLLNSSSIARSSAISLIEGLDRANLWSSVCHAATYLLAAGCPIPSFSGFSYFYRGLGGSHGILNVASPRRPNDLYQLTRRSAQLRSSRVSGSILWPVRHTLPTFTRCNASVRASRRSLNISALLPQGLLGGHTWSPQQNSEHCHQRYHQLPSHPPWWMLLPVAPVTRSRLSAPGTMEPTTPKLFSFKLNKLRLLKVCLQSA